MKTKELVYDALFAAIVIVLGLFPPITLPFIPVPITLQSMGVMLQGSFLGKKNGFISSLLVVILVLIGLPVLSGGRGGLGILTGPTGGYFIIWPIAAFVIGYLVEKLWKKINFWKYLVVNIIGGIILIDFFGALYLSVIAHMSVMAALISNLAFIPGDFIKAVIVSLICVATKKISLIAQIKHE
ncbi:biotin transporter BioY [Fructilactobacillus fructivorans]|uniref:Biotin transporter n=2 Tax=Fructilactobacillus fructivorans TaxID=1614 RepID=A0A0C1PNE1_9LACO|nr:biotin transporter BioY [Fructilactobacillus fructivorans]KID42242.1 Substrate-specific component BioY of biotin ECF transporter [Fructilactobacillus fructivorans]MCT0151132.1 biotin transporter BioY [Fructilactobacillus fructivorans]MCT2867310.1 biotin transporter BioY [Fructilactobacillus fructivorans]MCT2869170.1 biotin transporter BioY [Fructilactobacillus fructivorans]MCT2873109.1 biotin transporter BioY [Fructilactobacillus fructivorans]